MLCNIFIQSKQLTLIAAKCKVVSPLLFREFCDGEMFVLNSTVFLDLCGANRDDIIKGLYIRQLRLDGQNVVLTNTPVKANSKL